MVSIVFGKKSVRDKERRTQGSADGLVVESACGPDDPGFDKPAVAGLAIGMISRMSREELIRVIHGADLPLINGRNRQRLRYLDRDSLQRLAQLARRCCRNQGY
jgi:hypothetical protein